MRSNEDLFHEIAGTYVRESIKFDEKGGMPMAAETVESIDAKIKQLREQKKLLKKRDKIDEQIKALKDTNS